MVEVVLEEYLEEMATVYKNKEEDVTVAVNPDSNRIGNPYFKFFNNSDFRKADSVIRITFDNSDYIIYKDGKRLWKLNTQEKKLLIKILRDESKQYKGFTNWEAAKFNWNYEYFEEMFDFEKYFNGEYDEEYKDDPSYVSSKLKMPDYTKLNIQ